MSVSLVSPDASLVGSQATCLLAVSPLGLSSAHMHPWDLYVQISSSYYNTSLWSRTHPYGLILAASSS